MNLDRYRIVERIENPVGSGSSAAHVYRAVHTNTQEVVAIRVLSVEPNRLPDLGESIGAVARLGHPVIPRILGSGMANGRPYIVIPDYGAGSLADRFAAGLTGSLNPGQLLNELASALDHAHARGVIHGALTPSSVLLEVQSGSARLAGLGEAAVTPPDGSSPYLAPEVRSGQPASAASDQYAFGILALELLTDVPARRAAPLLQAGSATGNGSTPLDLNARAVLMLTKSLDPDPALRFASVGEANRALQIALGFQAPVIDSPAKPAPAEPTRKPRRLRFRVAALLILLIGLAGAVPAFSAGLIRLPQGGAGELFGGLSAESSSDPVGEHDSAQAPALNPEPTADEPSLAASEAEQPTEAQPSTEAEAGAPSPTATGGSGSEGPVATAIVETPTPAETSTPIVTDTPAPTATPEATATMPPTATSQPPTTVPTENTKKCNDNPKSPNYCTPVPSG